MDQKRFQEIVKGWGKLPERERAQAMQELTRDLPAKHRQIIEDYFRKLAQAEAGRR